MVKGSLNKAPDSLSRYPVSDPQTQAMLAERDPDNNMEASIAEIRAVSVDNRRALTSTNMQRRTMLVQISTVVWFIFSVDCLTKISVKLCTICIRYQSQNPKLNTLTIFNMKINQTTVQLILHCLCHNYVMLYNNNYACPVCHAR